MKSIYTSHIDNTKKLLYTAPSPVDIPSIVFINVRERNCKINLWLELNGIHCQELYDIVLVPNAVFFHDLNVGLGVGDKLYAQAITLDHKEIPRVNLRINLI